MEDRVNYMENFSLKTLEYDKVLKLVSAYARTSYGKEGVLALSPKTSYYEVKTLLDETEEAQNVLIRFQEHPYENYEGVLKSIELANKNGILEAISFLQVLALINTSVATKNFFQDLEENEKMNLHFLKNYFANLTELVRLKTSINLAINKEGQILDSASKNLFQIRRKIAQTENKIRTSLNAIMQHESTKLNEFLVVIRNNRMCLPVKIEYKNSFPGIIHDISSSNNTCYIEPAQTTTLSNELEALRQEEMTEIRIILQNLSLLVAAHYDELAQNLENLTCLDVIFAKAKYAENMMFKPSLTEKYEFNLDGVKHPLIDTKVCAPITVKMEEKTRAIIVTGPNTGGKTVALKTVGLCSLLVQSGIFVETKKQSSFHVFENILADIGDEQSIEESLSTFSSHMTRIIAILNKDLANSLILLDELGSGTDPKEGSALAIAILEKLDQLGAKTIVTTHYTDLKNYAYSHEGIVNASVEFNINTLRPTYRLLLGVPGASNALLIAKNLGLAEDIVTNSEKYLANTGAFNKDIANYEEKMAEMANKEDKLNAIIEENERLKAELSLEKSKLEHKRQEFLNKVKKEAEEIITKAKADSDNLLAEIKALKNESEVKIHEIAKLKNKTNLLGVSMNEENIFSDELAVGDFVLIKTYNKTGVIKKIQKDKYEVNFGQFTMEFKKKDLVKTTKPKTKEKPKVIYSGYNNVSGAAMSLDLRGKRYEEVKDLVEDFLDKACLANYEQVSIIHGFGTGVVRNRVWEVLKANSNVKAYRFGKEGEGLNGVTVVTLK